MLKEYCQSAAFEYIDLRLLRDLRLDDPKMPFRKLTGLSFQWNRMKPLERVKFLTSVQDVKPAYK
jgi:hypothetical protein